MSVNLDDIFSLGELLQRLYGIELRRNLKECCFFKKEVISD